MIAPNRPPFRSSLFGLMIAVAEIASALALERTMTADLHEDYEPYLFMRIIAAACSIMLVLSLHVAVARFCERPMQAGRLFRYPGFSGPVMVLIVSIAMLGMRCLVRDSNFRMVFPALLWVFAGAAVATFWLLSAWVNGWLPASCWNDRVGRLLGFSWIAGALLLILPPSVQ